MKNQLFAFCLLAFFAISCQSGQTEQQPATQETPAATMDSNNTLTEEEKAAGWKLLFDGQSTDQWRAYGKDAFPSAGWAVENGELVVQKAPNPRPEGYGGDIITKESFGNFELKLDFMISDTSNSGILYLVKEEKDVPIWHNAPEYQILDDATWETMGAVDDMATHRTCDNYDLQAAPSNFMKAKSEWNTATLIVNNGHVEHWLNGNKCVEYQLGSPEWEAMVKKSKFKDYPGYGRAKSGPIGLQDHDHEVRFRNIKIKSL
jgi:hypothetical protein